MTLIGTFTAVQFGEVYLKGIGLPVNKAMLPNLTFTIAVGLYVILRYEHNPT